MWRTQKTANAKLGARPVTAVFMPSKQLPEKRAPSKVLKLFWHYKALRLLGTSCTAKSVLSSAAPLGLRVTRSETHAGTVKPQAQRLTRTSAVARANHSGQHQTDRTDSPKPVGKCSGDT